MPFSPWLLALLVLGAVVAAAGAFYAALPWIAQPLMRALLWPHYRVIVTGVENVPPSGPALIVANHSTWLDGFFLAGFTPRRGKAMVSAALVNKPVLQQIARRAGIISTPYTGPHAIRTAIAAGREALEEGNAVGVFAEGQISRSGFVGRFQRGIEAILRGNDDVPVIPVALDNLWGSFFSRAGGKFFHNRPKAWRRTVVLAFGPPVTPPVTAFKTRQAVLEQLVIARTITGTPDHPLETIDRDLPFWEHPELGLLTASTPDIRVPNIDLLQIGVKPGTVGTAIPGVAVRAVDDAGQPLPPDSEGRLEARIPDRNGWIDTGRGGSLDRDGFVRLTTSESAPESSSAG
jgi:1-acyl-sn-glycerol-3-phosphate acyltransferase